MNEYTKDYGKVGLTFEHYQQGKAVEELTLVAYQGELYVSLRGTVMNDRIPTASDDWFKISTFGDLLDAIRQVKADSEQLKVDIENIKKECEAVLGAMKGTIEAELQSIETRATAAIKQINDTNNSVKTAEAQRVEAENLRKSAETLRAKAEDARILAESVRENKESARQQAEARRVSEFAGITESWAHLQTSINTTIETANAAAARAVAAAQSVEEVIARANAAADRANTEADAANLAAGSANTAAQSANTAATMAGNVNAVLNGDELTVTDRNGQSVTRNVRGPKGDSVTMFPAVTIFGQPRIQETQMSEFSAQNYAQFPFLVDFDGRHWQLDFSITTGADVSQQHNVFDSNFGLAFAFSGGKFVLAMSSNGTSWNLGATSGTHSILANYTYYIRITWDGAQYKLSASINKVDWIEDIVVNSTESLASKQIIIGKSLDNAHIFNGSINFAEARLTIANVIVWEGMEEVGTATRMAIDMSNIDEAGKQRVNQIVNDGEVGGKLSAIELSTGPYAPRPNLALEVDKDNMAIDAATGRPIAKSGWAISKPLLIVRGNTYCIKVGKTDGNVWCAAKQTVIPAWDEEVKDPETGEVIDVIHHDEEVYYSKKTQLNADAELPIDGKLRVIGMPSDFYMVVSFHKETAGSVVEVRRDGSTANICTQIGEVDSSAEENLNANMDNVAQTIGEVGNVVDTLEYRIGQYPMVLLGNGVPSASVRPINLGVDNDGFPLPWFGTPEFVGQQYIDIDASNGGLYYAVPSFDMDGNISSFKWANANA